jgi:hypothetical protein
MCREQLEPRPVGGASPFEAGGLRVEGGGEALPESLGREVAAGEKEGRGKGGGIKEVDEGGEDLVPGSAEEKEAIAS